MKTNLEMSDETIFLPQSTYMLCYADRKPQRVRNIFGGGALINMQTFLWIFSIYLITSIITFILYAYDKTAAGKDKMRIPEVLLHFSEAMGGWPGGMIARPVLHHKTNWQKKSAFKITNWLIILAHLGFWVWYLFLK